MYIKNQSTKDINIAKNLVIFYKEIDMNKEEIIKYCLTLENTYKDCPFPEIGRAHV